MNSNLHPIILHRYTNVSELDHLLENKKIRFSCWKHWDDENDKSILDIYQKSIRKSVFILCLTNSSETIHHWNSYARNNGCRIMFNWEVLYKYLSKSGVIFKQVEYIKYAELKIKKIELNDLPFIKRHPYHIEKEYRLLKKMISGSNEFSLKVGLDIIQEISLSPFNTSNQNAKIKNKLIKKYPSLEKKFSNSKIINFDNWINHFSEKFSK
jgi:hypothetical protein